jgi:hypothetical protein
MDTWMILGTTPRINWVHLEIPSFGQFKNYSVRQGPLEKRTTEQSRSISQGKDSRLLRSMPILLPYLAQIGELSLYVSMTPEERHLRMNPDDRNRCQLDQFCPMMDNKAFNTKSLRQIIRWMKSQARVRGASVDGEISSYSTHHP